MLLLFSTHLSSTEVAHGILSWEVASNRTHSVLSGIFLGSNEAQAMPTLDFF